jgi:hypothetical protein
MTRRYSFRSRLGFFALAALSSVLGAATPAQAQFETRAMKPILPYGAFSIATGDFNHDGKADIAVTVDGGFSVLLGNGDGTFQKPIFYATQLSYSLAVGDFNNDGNLDIVVANENLSPSTVSVYLGNGDGTFKAPVSSNTTSYNEFVAVGDFNGDGKLDIVLIENPSISVLLGNGDGTFQPPNDNDSFLGAHWLSVGDFNNDHKLDVIVVGYFGENYDMGVLLGNGDGTLQNSLTYPLEYVPATVAAGDLNGDGNLDAVVGYDLDGLTVFLGNGNGSFQPGVFYSTMGLAGGPITIIDLNLDGKLDLAVQGGPSPGVDVYWGDGTGAFQPAQFFGSGQSGYLAVGDLNGDRLPDFAMVNPTYGAITMLNTGVASFSPTTPLAFPVQPINSNSRQQAVILTNDGTTALSITSIKASRGFQVSETCGTSVAVGGNCSINVLFKPKTAGTYAGSVTIIDGASSKPQFVELSGSATVVKVSPTSLKFGGQMVGTKSAPQVITATNVGSAVIQFSSVTIGGMGRGDFSQTNNCSGLAVEPGASCEVTVTFDPTKTGARDASLYLNLPSGSVSPAPLTLTGTGT